MTPTASRRLLLVALLPALVPACSSPNPELYTLAPVPGTPEPGGPARVAIHRAAIARYLERPGIVRSSENYRLEVQANQEWGEPLAQMITRVLAEDLRQRLPGSTIYADSGAITVAADAAVEVNIDRMDSESAGVLAFSAMAAVRFPDSHQPPATRAVRGSIPIASVATADEVRAMSIGIGQLADAIAAMLRAHSAAGRKA
jgi:uncharacterized lipoprotein YmbA